jgi:hypothetical protein
MKGINASGYHSLDCLKRVARTTAACVPSVACTGFVTTRLLWASNVLPVVLTIVRYKS